MLKNTYLSHEKNYNYYNFENVFLTAFLLIYDNKYKMLCFTNNNQYTIENI